jgi:hypothetical protein
MKQKLYIFGMITALVILTGTVFKVNHYPGAGIMLTVGIAILVLVFLPLALINHYRSEESNKNVLLYIVTFLTSLVVFTGMLFKIQHWPYAGIALTVALPFPFIVFLPVFLSVTSKNKNFNIYNTVFVLLLLALNSVFCALLSLNVTKARIDDSYNLSRAYNNFERALAQLPVSHAIPAISIKINETVKIVNEYQEAILKHEGLTMQQWKSNPDLLRRPDLRAVPQMALMPEGDAPVGTRLENSLNGLITLMGNTRGYEDIAKAAPELFELTVPGGSGPGWYGRIFVLDNLSWVLIYLDGLKCNLEIIKSQSVL